MIAACRAGSRVRVFFMDEARFGQQGTTTRVWALRGSRPTAVKQTRYEWLYLYAAVEPATGSVWPCRPRPSTPAP